MAGNTVRKIAPFIDTDIFAAESWLSDMAAKGLFFKEGAFWWNLVFEKGEPAKRRYRLVPAEPMELYTITTGEMSVYESAGWHYAGVYQGCSSINSCQYCTSQYIYRTRTVYSLKHSRPVTFEAKQIYIKYQKSYHQN